MLKVELTPNLLGFKITGDYEDLNELYDAIWTVHFYEMPMDDEPQGTFDEITMSTRLLALNYDLRHAYQGDRHTETVHNGYDEYTAERPAGATKKNVVYAVEVIYPELIYELIALNYLIDAYVSRLPKAMRQVAAYSPSGQIRTDSTIGIIMRFQGKAIDAIKAVASAGRFSKIVDQINRNYAAIPMMYTQWLDIIDRGWIDMSPAKRAEALSTTVRDIAEFYRHDQYLDVKLDIDEAVRQGQKAEDQRFERETAEASQINTATGKAPFVYPHRKLNRTDFNLRLPEWPDDLNWGYGKVITFPGTNAAKEPSPAQASPTQPCPAQTTPAQASPTQPTPAQTTPAQPSPAPTSSTPEEPLADFDAKREQIMLGNAQLLSDFECHLESQGLSLKTIRKHVENIEFYINVYLMREGLRPSQGWESDLIRGFVGNFFIYKCAWCSKTSIKDNATSLKKFYAFLQGRGLITGEAYQEVASCIKEELPDWLKELEAYENGEDDWYF